MVETISPKSDLVVSVVAAVHESESYIEFFLRDVTALLKTRFRNYEVVIVDDASTDATCARIKGIQSDEPNIQLYRLARSVGPEVALVAGLDQCLGDVIVTIEPQFDPIQPISEMIDLFQQGNDIVYGEREDRISGKGSGFYHNISRWFFWFFYKITGFELPIAASTLTLYSRRTLSTILDNADRYSLLRVLPAFTGFPFASVLYERRHEPAPRNRYFSAVKRGLSILLLSSVWPLRALSFLSLIAASVNLIYMFYVVGVLFVKSQVAEGWVSMSLQISGLFFLLFFVLAVLSEYVSRLFLQNQRRSRYIIAEERVSNSLASERLLNVYRGSKPGRPST